MKALRAVLAVIALLAPTVTLAQRDGGSAPKNTAAPAVHTSTPLRAAAVVAEALPRGLVTVIIPVPVELRAADSVTFEVRVSGAIEVLGRRAGHVASRGSVVRPLALTMRVPAGADAGPLDAAEVLFRASDGRDVVVPVVVSVTVVRDVALSGPREMRGLRNGDRVELAYRLVNAGNATDTLIADIEGPDGWTVRLARSAQLVVPAHRPVELVVHLGIPPTANVGDHPLTVSVRRAGAEESAASLFTALGISGHAGDVGGVVVKSTIAGAAASTGRAVFTSATVDGPVAADVFFRGHINSDVTGDGMTMQGLGAVGAMAAPFSASLYGRRWDVSAGTVGLELSDLTGVSIAGQGVTTRVARTTWDARAIGARPAVGANAEGDLFGAGFWRLTSRGRFGGSASRLQERSEFAFGRELTALGLDYTTAQMGSVVIGGSFAHRASAGGSGLGYGFAARHERNRDRVSASFTHAPGGSAAFARAVDEWQGEAARNFTERWAIDVSATHSRDAGNVFSSMDVSSWSVGQRLLLTPATTLSMRGQSSTFDARAAASTIGDFGASERALTSAIDWQRGFVAVNVEGSIGDVERTTELSDGRLDRASAAQQSVEATVMRASPRWGTLEGRAGVQHTASGVGIPGQVWNASARWKGLPFSIRDQQLRLDAEASYQRLGALQAALVTRAGLRMALPGGLEMAVAAERNPFFRDAKGRPGWIGAARLTAATRVFSPRALGPEGVVYEDQNQNGRRDPNEPGVADVVVRRGETRATTNAKGLYRLPARSRGRTLIEQASLPIGLLADPSLATDSAERLDLPVLPSGTVNVELELVADEDGRVPQVDLEQATVILRDARGFEWVGRRTGKTTAVFDGVPIGTYELRFDFARLREPLRAPEGVKVIVAPHEQQTIKAALRGRSIRIFDQGRGGGRTTDKQHQDRAP